jgi:hypothetical protein
MIIGQGPDKSAQAQLGPKSRSQAQLGNEDYKLGIGRQLSGCGFFTENRKLKTENRL